MKKITLLFALCLGIYISSAQQTISFESSEGYTLGDINTQNGWVSTGDGMGNFLTNQVISDVRSTDGNWSFNVTTEVGVPAQSNPVVGGFYSYPFAIVNDGSTISYDVYIELPLTGDTNVYRFGITGPDVDELGNPGTYFLFIVDFDFQNNIRVVDNSSNFVNVGTWVADTWYNIRIEMNAGQAEYFIDDISVGTYNLLRDINFDGARFIHDNFGGQAFFDNFRTNDEPLSTDGFDIDKFDYFVDAQNRLNLTSNENLSSVKLYNMLGQEVLSEKLSNPNETIDINGLNSGAYLGQVQINNNTETFKFIKN
jgi:hypothetical protein